MRSGARPHRALKQVALSVDNQPLRAAWDLHRFVIDTLPNLAAWVIICTLQFALCGQTVEAPGRYRFGTQAIEESETYEQVPLFRVLGPLYGDRVAALGLSRFGRYAMARAGRRANNGYAHSNPNRDSNRDSDRDSNRDAFGHAHRHTYGYADEHADARPDEYVHDCAQRDAHADRDAYADRHDYPHDVGHGHADAAAITGLRCVQHPHRPGDSDSQ